jgi:hypothetical protein
MGIFICQTFMDPKLNVGPALKVFTKCLENLLINHHQLSSSIIMLVSLSTKTGEELTFKSRIEEMSITWTRIRKKINRIQRSIDRLNIFIIAIKKQMEDKMYGDF